MITLMRQNSSGHIVYEVDHVTSWNDFLQWLYKVEQDDFSVSIKNSVYHFRTYEERVQFIFGFEMAWNVFDPEEIIE